MNEYDSARIADILVARGATPVPVPEQADLVVLNTCHIREKAAEKVYSELGRLALLRTGGGAVSRRPLLAVAGCVAQGEGEEILRRAPQVDFVIGPQAFHRFNELLDAELASVADGQEQESKQRRKQRRKESRGRRMALEFPTESKFDFLPEEHLPRGVSAYLAVQEGCDRLCSFCVVPYTRGPEFSRSPEEVLAEAKRLFAQGVRELTLLGQNVNAYSAEDAGGQVWDLARLLEELSKCDDCLRLRYYHFAPTGFVGLADRSPPRFAEARTPSASSCAVGERQDFYTR